MFLAGLADTTTLQGQAQEVREQGRMLETNITLQNQWLLQAEGPLCAKGAGTEKAGKPDLRQM